MEVREKLSRKPVRVPDEPGGETMKHQAKDLLEASGAMSGDLNLDDAMKITMLKLLKDMQQGKTSRKKKTSRPSELGGIFKQRRSSRVEFIVPGRTRHRSSGKASGCYEKPSRSLPKPHGGSHV